MERLSKYMRQKITQRLVASRTWILTYSKEAFRCQFCWRIASCTTIEGNYASVRSIDVRGWAICHRCLRRTSLRREREQPYMERRLYGKDVL